MFNNNSGIIDYNGHAYVEIGGVKWATMNVGAKSETDYGQYFFQWGDTTGYDASSVGASGTTNAKPFDLADYKFSGGRQDVIYIGFTKYNDTDGKAVLDICDDAAQANWGGSWRMPTTAEFRALGTATTSAWTSSYQGSGVSGLVLTSKADSSKKLFFPAAGQCRNGIVGLVGRVGCYWSSSYAESGEAYIIDFNMSDVYWDSYYGCYNGFSVRPVVG